MDVTSIVPKFYDLHFQAPSVLSMLESCNSMRELKQIHACVVKSRNLQTQIVFNKIISFCALSPFGDLQYAQLFHTRIQNPTSFIYNAIIRGFSSENPKKSLSFYVEMLENGLLPDNFTYPFLFKACAETRALKEGEMIHVHTVKTGFVLDLYVSNTLMRMYTICKQIKSAQKLFDKIPDRDLVTWTTLISGYAQVGLPLEAIRIFLCMKDTSKNLVADGKTIVIILSSCSKLGDLKLGKKIHFYIIEKKLKVDVYVCNALIDMYLKCGDCDSAFQVFDGMSNRNVVTWNSMISGLAQKGDFKKSLSVFQRMQEKGIKPDDITLVGVLNCCANIGALEMGRWIHVYAKRKNKFLVDGFIGNALIDMYSKCGNIDEALNVFTKMKYRDVYTYTTMIMGLAMHGRGKKALEMFDDMQAKKIRPDEVTFVGVLFACSHSGLVEEGRRHFEDMSKLYGLKPRMEHFGCMVDLLGRTGQLIEAEEFIMNMPIPPDSFLWSALLGACKVHGEMEIGDRISKRLMNKESMGEEMYVLMSNMYVLARRGRDAIEIRKVMKEKKLRKKPGCSMIEIEGVVHEFRAGEKSHPKRKEIYLMLNEMNQILKV